MGQGGLRSFQGSVGWYRTSFTVPHDGEYALRFESVSHRASVWVDGKRLGDHIGAVPALRARCDALRRHALTSSWSGRTGATRSG